MFDNVTNNYIRRRSQVTRISSLKSELMVTIVLCGFQVITVSLLSVTINGWCFISFSREHKTTK